jgi:CelD/BcsL family acetyltransferase involved in cellulose biosynthesis
MSSPPPPHWPHAEVWDRLALRSGNLFSTLEWAETWVRHLGSEGESHVLLDDPSDPRVLLPLHRSGRLVRQLRFLGNGPADQLGPVCAPEDRPLAARMVRERLLEGTDLPADVFLLQDVPVADGWEALLPGGTEVRSTPSPVVHFQGTTWKEHLAAQSKNFRSQARRRPRRLADELPGASIRQATHETLERDLDELFRLHKLTWGDDAPYANGAERAFHEDFARTALDRGWLRLWVMEDQGQVLAALHCFAFGKAHSSYQAGRDPALEHLSLGFVMYVHALEQALQEGCTEFRLLRGDEGYKSRFAKDESPLHSLAYGRTLRGRAAVRATARLRS